MRIESFIHGRSIGTESAYDALMTYFAVLTKEDGYNVEDINEAFPKLIYDYLGMFLNCLIDNGQIHVATVDGDRLLDQYVVHDLDTDSWRFL